jgi:hypothetical protein
MISLNINLIKPGDILLIKFTQYLVTSIDIESNHLILNTFDLLNKYMRIEIFINKDGSDWIVFKLINTFIPKLISTSIPDVILLTKDNRFLFIFSEPIQLNGVNLKYADLIER